jgi:hypothetical protein
MSDEADITQARQELEEAIRRKYTQLIMNEAEPTGKCLNCGVRCKDKRWCDKDCEDDWEYRRRRGFK